MSALHPLRGGCHCGRNRYIIDMPEGADDIAQVLFNADASHRSSLATPLAAFIRVPLSWYQSTTYSFFPDETHSMIHRVFESPSPSRQQTKRHFCGFCGTPLSYWTERPAREADFIQLTLASLRGEDLRDLEDMGLLPGSSDESEVGSDPNEGDEEAEGATAAQSAATSLPGAGPMDIEPLGSAPLGLTAKTTTPSVAQSSLMHRTLAGLPWFESMVEGSRLGNVHRRQGVEQSRDGTSRTEWEIVEWTEGDVDEDENGGDDNDEATEPVVEDVTEDVDMSSNPGKRKLRDRGDSDAAAESPR